MVATFGNEDPGLSTVHKWVAEFRRRRKTLEVDPWSLRPVTPTVDENIGHVHDMVTEDRLLTINSQFY